MTNILKTRGHHIPSRYVLWYATTDHMFYLLREIAQPWTPFQSPNTHTEKDATIKRSIQFRKLSTRCFQQDHFSASFLFLLQSYSSFECRSKACGILHNQRHK